VKPGSTKPGLGIGLVGHAFMGAAHSQAWRTAGRFFDLPWEPDLAVLCGRDPGRARAAADRLGWREVETDWKALLRRDDVALVDVCTPGDTHARSRSRRWTRASTCSARSRWPTPSPRPGRWWPPPNGPAPAACTPWSGFNYRRVPAVALARRLVEQGRIGEVRHVRGAYLQDWIVDPEFPLVWRLQADRAGSGALGDIGAHVVDLAQFVTGQELTGVSAVTETFVRERPLPAEAHGLAAAGGAGRGPVTVDDAALFVGRLPGAGSRASRRPGSRPAARTRCGWRSTAASARWPSTSRR
jgi:predicted dehydrogenase